MLKNTKKHYVLDKTNSLQQRPRYTHHIQQLSNFLNLSCPHVLMTNKQAASLPADLKIHTKVLVARPHI